jgi:two-component system, chemotaxis family, sensor kinase CheA
MRMERDPYKYFRIEARELLEVLGQGALDLEKGRAGSEAMGPLLRAAHTLKGAARVVKQAEMAELAHRVEEVLVPHRAGGAMAPARAGEILRLVSEMGARLAGLDQPGPSAGGRARGDEAIQAIAIDVDEADAVLRILSEQGAHLAALPPEVAALEQASRLAGVLGDQLGPRRGGAAGGGAASAKALAIVEDLRALVARVRRGVSAAADQAERDHAELVGAAERLRLAATGALFTPLERAVRDAAVALGKRVEFTATGGENRLDLAVLSPLRQALLHVVRNAVAHGLESPLERAAAGKPEAGRVELRIERRGQQLAFVCRDDGRGIALEAVRRAAVERGIVSAAEAESLGREETLRLTLRSGVSTSRSVDEVSGRGVGLDVVREVAARLRGQVSLTSDPGAGTTVELCVPVTLSSLTVLSVEAGGAVAGLPLESVRRTLRVAPGEVGRSGGCEVVFDGSEVVPFLRLASALRREARKDPARPCSAVVVQEGDGRVAVGVDRLLGVESVLVRPLPPLSPPSPLTAGFSLGAGGVPRLVLDPGGLARAVRAGSRAPAVPLDVTRRTVLVVDDSLTTRMLEQSILESAGYEVELAVSAEEALEKASARRYGLFVVDVEMPGMNGFDFVARTRADAALRETPAILVTSRSSAEDRRRGEEAGARAYMVKSEFDQVQLLRTIRELMG